MAVLQAARALELGLDLDAAKSWGLNRAIFYLLARRGVLQRQKQKRKRQAAAHLGRKRDEPSVRESYFVGGEKAYRAPGPVLRFMMGGKVQEPEQFDRQVMKRFPDWEGVWREARAIVHSAPRWALTKPSRFYENVYKSRRDRLMSAWAQDRVTPESRSRLTLIRGGKKQSRASGRKAA